jgi:hypothetical protein
MAHHPGQERTRAAPSGSRGKQPCWAGALGRIQGARTCPLASSVAIKKGGALRLKGGLQHVARKSRSCGLASARCGAAHAKRGRRGVSSLARDQRRSLTRARRRCTGCEVGPMRRWSLNWEPTRRRQAVTRLPIAGLVEPHRSMAYRRALADGHRVRPARG